jgi:CubicO group peptidase (beta-lactamase class C family)
MPPPGALPPPPPTGPLRPAAEAALPASPAGGAYSTAADMARFFDALQAGRLVSAAWVKQLTQPQIDASPPRAPVKLRYGFGFDAGEWQGHRSFGHNGGTPGVNVEAHRFPDDDVTLIVLSNEDPPMAAQRYAALRSAVFGGTLCR